MGGSSPCPPHRIRISMLEIEFKIDHYLLNQSYDEDIDDFSFLENIGQRYDYMLYHSSDINHHRFKIKLDEGYNVKVALIDILTELNSVGVIEFNFRVELCKLQPQC